MLQEHMKQSLDLTNLNTSATRSDILALCNEADRNRQFVAAVCSWSKFAPYIHTELRTTGIKTAVVVNFPDGTDTVETVVRGVKRALFYNVEEIDLVIDYERYNNEQNGVFELVNAVRMISDNFTLKVILETGGLKPSLIYPASWAAMVAGANYLKTSTGKLSIGATLGATKYMCEAVQRYYLINDRRVGLKYSGGIKTALDAQKFIWQLHQYDLGAWLKHGLIRFGVGTSSSVLEEWSKIPVPFSSSALRGATQLASENLKTLSELAKRR